ncbi:CdaR family protein [Deinococcus yavapaiensis]|uniref:YbbR domain-containing protein n=1 Tax=Deinococcus yavapaiensis KR-236 TaxID=694435 RepID=A0A318S981_9DEIO|nr:CdaR family protein [Deinococcus yavapaiensis]PYE55690.1 YbbR domain-containing protein [Deinococcus yavapaiensis KR-236]
MKQPRSWLAYATRRTLHNLPQKLAALGVAVALWFGATADRREIVERSFTTQLQIVDDTPTTLGSERRSVTVPSRTVRVTLSGPNSTLRNLDPTAIDSTINVTNAGEGDFQATIRVRAPDDLRVVRFSPTVASGFIDTTITRTLPVRLSVTTPPDRALPTYGVTPNAVQVTGPQRVAESVANVYTVPLSLARGTTIEARLVALDASGRPITNLRLNPATVSVTRTDESDLPIKTLSVTLADSPREFEVVSAEVDPPSVRVLADDATLARLTRVVARVQYREGQYTTRANLALPTGARSLDMVTVTLDVRRRGANP